VITRRSFRAAFSSSAANFQSQRDTGRRKAAPHVVSEIFGARFEEAASIASLPV